METAVIKTGRKDFSLRNEKDYSLAKKSLANNYEPFFEHIKGSSISLGKIGFKKKGVLIKKERKNTVDFSPLTRQAFISFLGVFAKNLYKNLRENDIINLEIPFEGATKHRNIPFFNSIKDGELFYTVDANQSYWQSLHNIKYIDDDLYNEYKFQEEYKKAKRLCVSFLVRKNKRIYYHLKEHGSYYEICSETSCFERVYQNVRNYLYNSIKNCVERCQGEYIDYTIDGISIMPDKVDIVKRAFIENNLDFKIIRCVKINSNMYMSGNNLRAFTKIKIK